MENITFKNITVLHNFHKSVLFGNNGDHATVRNVRYENVVVEDAQMGRSDGWNSLAIPLQDGAFSQEPNAAKCGISHFENIKVIGGNATANRIKGFSAEHTVEGVHIKNVEVLGEKNHSMDGYFVTKSVYCGHHV